MDSIQKRAAHPRGDALSCVDDGAPVLGEHIESTE
jgi:hypothetical protein